MTDLRLIAYQPNGASLGPLPTPSAIQAGFPLNDVGALTLSYHPDAARSDLLGQPLEVATEVSTDGGMTWAEPVNGRFLYLRDGRDPIKTEDAWAVEAPGYVKRLEKALVGTQGLDEDGKRPYVTQTPGAILLDLFQRAQGRGALAGMTATWTATHDSAGTAWPEAQSITYDPGTHLLAVLQSMADDGWVDFRTQGRSVQVYVPETAAGMGRDRTTLATPVTLRFGRDLTEAPFRRTWEGLADTAVILGDQGVTVTRINPAAIKPWGVQETYVTAGGVADEGTLAVLGDAALTFTEGPRAEHTLGLEFAAAAHLPFRDYLPGDWVYAATSGLTAPERMRVQAITLTRDAQGAVGGNVTLNDRFLEADILQNRRIQRIIQGATQAGTGGTPSGIGPDILAPDQVEGMAVSSAAYVTPDGLIRGQVSLQWLDVTQNADNTPTNDVAGYEVWARMAGFGDWFQAAETTASEWYASGYESGKTWEFKVRAFDTSQNLGAFSAVVSTTIAADLTPPPETSQPTVASRLGTAQVAWDGKTVGGSDMRATVPDWRRVAVHVSTVNNFTPTDSTLVDDLVGPGYVVAGPLTYGTTYYARLVAYDSSGNASTPSAQRAFTVAPLVDVSNFPDSAMAELYARTGKFLDLTADNFSANLIEGAWVKAGAISADKMTLAARAVSVLRNSYMEDADAAGRPLFWSLVWGWDQASLAGEAATPISGTRSLRVTLTGTTGGNAVLGDQGSEVPVYPGQKWFARVRVKALQATNRDVALVGKSCTADPAVTPFSIFDSRASGDFLTGPSTKFDAWAAGEERTLEGYWTVPTDTTAGARVRGNISLEVGMDGAAGDVFLVDALEFWPAVTDTQITDITPGKIRTGILQATERIVAGSLSGARAELNGVGFQAFAADGRKMFEVQANSGETYVGDANGIHMMLGAYQNWWNGNVSSAILKFRYAGSGWGEGQLFAQYWTDSGYNWAALRLQSPYVGDPFANAAYLDVRNRSDGYSQFYLRAAEANFSANTFIMGSNGTTIDFRTFNGPGFTFSDYGATSRLNLYPNFGYFLVRAINDTGAAQQLRLQGSQVALSFTGDEIYGHQEPSGGIGLHSFDKNVGLQFVKRSGVGTLVVSNWAITLHAPIEASAFQVNSDPRVKSNAQPVTGALAAVRALKVYDYEMAGILPRKAEPDTAKRILRPDEDEHPTPPKGRARGVMADEVAKVLPDAAKMDEQGRLSVSLYDLLATTMAAVQELAAQVDTLKAAK